MAVDSTAIKIIVDQKILKDWRHETLAIGITFLKNVWQTWLREAVAQHREVVEIEVTSNGGGMLWRK